MTTVIDRFMSKVSPEPNSGCWLWLGTGTKQGYGFFWDGANFVRAHRAAYRLFRGNIPAGLHIDHLCRVRCCVNPDHLEPVTCKENTRRGLLGAVQAARMLSRTHCPHGHEYTPSNTIIGKRPRGEYRLCRACRIECDRRRRRARAVA